MKKDRHAGAIKSDANKESFKNPLEFLYMQEIKIPYKNIIFYQPCYSIQLSNLLKVSVQCSNIS
jgi:hypothetical protein